MRFFNNTKYQDVPAKELFNEIKHLLTVVNITEVESIELNDESITVFGVECVLLEHKLNQPLKTTGTVRWFDSISGSGAIRLSSGTSVQFYSCNVVGADSCYPQLVSNVSFAKGETVSCEISTDQFMFREIGAINIRKGE